VCAVYVCVCVRESICVNTYVRLSDFACVCGRDTMCVFV